MPQGLQALIAAADSDLRGMVETVVVRRGLEPVRCSTVSESQALLVRQPICVVFCEQGLADGSFLDMLEGVQAAANPVPVVVLSRRSDFAQYLEAMNSGAFDYLTCPCSHAELTRVVDRALETVSLYAA